MLMLLQGIKELIFKKKKGGPILEEILLIGIAILIFAIIFGIIMSLIDWSQVSFENHRCPANRFSLVYLLSLHRSFDYPVRIAVRHGHELLSLIFAEQALDRPLSLDVRVPHDHGCDDGGTVNVDEFDHQLDRLDKIFQVDVVLGLHIFGSGQEHGLPVRA